MEKIVLVDDDEDLLLVLTHALRANGYDVTPLADPAQIMSSIVSLQPNIVILDIDLGNADGRLICRQLKAMHGYKQLPVVLYSGLEEDKDTLLTCNADLFLHKPLSTSYFLKKIAGITPARWRSNSAVQAGR